MRSSVCFAGSKVLEQFQSEMALAAGFAQRRRRAGIALDLPPDLI
jgi:hypothetical protein